MQPGLELNSSPGYATTYSAQGGFTTGVWHHAVWVLSSPNFSNYSAQWSLIFNGSLVPFIGSAFLGLYPLPVYRPLSFIGGSDYSNANLPLTLDAFRIYDYALQANTIANIYNTLYNPSRASSAGSSTGGSSPVAPSGVCSTVSGKTGGDWSAAMVVPRAAVLNLNFTSSPSCATNTASNWAWAASDPLDSPSVAALHQGVALLNGSITSYIDMTTASGLSRPAQCCRCSAVRASTAAAGRWSW